MSQDAKQRLEIELDALEMELRVDIPRAIKLALEWGDLRENSEYKAALDRQSFVQARISQMRQRLSEIANIDFSKVPHNRASYGSTVVLYDGEKDEEITYKLVMAEESDPNAGLISTSSPVGKSLLNREEGDEVQVVTPKGKRTFEIRSLRTIHDDIAAKEAETEGAK